MPVAPPVAPAFMLSLLTRRCAELGKEAFAQAHPGPWLVWEPGRWSTSGLFDPTKRSSGVSVTPTQADSLAFQLRTRTALKVGRATHCDIVINDATVSREHLLLEPDGDGWRLTVLSSGSTELDGGRLPPKLGVTLRPGAQLRLGDVVLACLDAQGLAERVLTGA